MILGLANDPLDPQGSLQILPVSIVPPSSHVINLSPGVWQVVVLDPEYFVLNTEVSSFHSHFLYFLG